MIDKITAGTLYSYGYKLLDSEGNVWELNSIIGKDILCLWRGHDKKFIYFEEIGTTYKVLARDLEQLTQEIEQDGETFIPIDRMLWEYNFNTDIMQRSEINEYAESMIEIDISARVKEMLHSWHFNIGFPENTTTNLI